MSGNNIKVSFFQQTVSSLSSHCMCRWYAGEL